MDDEVTPVFSSPQEEVAHWRAQCQSLASTLEETRSALEDFQASSKELEYELEREMATTEVREKELRGKVDKLVADADDWKTKYQAAVRENSSSVSKMQRELEAIRLSQQQLKDRLRDMEMDNDELERSERTLETTLQDLEQRHDRAIERATLLEEELINKANLEEENQRLKDELRDMGEELAIISGQQGEIERLRKEATEMSNELTILRERPVSISSELSSPYPSTAPDIAPQTLSSDYSDRDVDPTPRKKDTPDVSAKRARNGNGAASPTKKKITSSPLPSLHSKIPASPTKRVTSSPMGSSGLSASTMLPRSRAAHGLSSIPSPSKSSREKQAQEVIQDVKAMAARMKDMTARLDSRRSLALRPGPSTTSIPLPKGASTSLARSTAAPRRNLDSASPPTQPPSKAHPQPRPSSGTSSPDPSVQTERKGKRRSSLRMSMGGAPVSGSGKRSASRLSSLSASSTCSSRIATPTNRSPTPDAAPPPMPNLNASVRPHSALSANRSLDSTALSASTAYGSKIPGRRKSVGAGNLNKLPPQTDVNNLGRSVKARPHSIEADMKKWK